MIAPLFALVLALPAAPQDDDLRPARFETDLAVSEDAASSVQRDLKNSFVRALATQDWTRVEEAFADGFEARFPALAQGTLVADGDPRILDLPAGTGTLDAETFTRVLRDALGDWVAVDRAKLKLFGFLLQPEATGAWGEAHLVLAGRLPGERRAELRASLELTVARAGEEPWRLTALRLTRGHHVEGTPRFVDVTHPTGFHFNESADQRAYNLSAIDDREVLAVGGVNALDWNRDGFPDLLATWHQQMTVLFVNDGRGGFVRERLPLELPRDAATAFLFVDLDGDGLEELIGSQVSGYRDGEAWLDLFTRVDGVWERRERALPFAYPDDRWGLAPQCLEAGDIDGDGDLDLFLGVHSDSRSRGADFNRFESYDGAENRLFVNQGELRFTEEAQARGLSGTQYTFVAKLFDFDEDGDLDLFEGNDYGPNWLWTNDGGGNFTRADDHPLSAEAAYTMGITLADADNTGARDLHLSNMYSHAGGRIVPLATTLDEDVRAKLAILRKGNQVFSRAADADTDDWTEHGGTLGVDDSGWAWGSIFFDVENDGDQDLFVVNGYSSNRDEEAPDW